MTTTTGTTPAPPSAPAPGCGCQSGQGAKFLCANCARPETMIGFTNFITMTGMRPDLLQGPGYWLFDRPLTDPAQTEILLMLCHIFGFAPNDDAPDFAAEKAAVAARIAAFPLFRSTTH